MIPISQLTESPIPSTSSALFVPTVSSSGVVGQTIVLLNSSSQAPLPTATTPSGVLLFRPIKPAVAKLRRQRPAAVVSPSVLQGMEELGLDSRRRRFVLVASPAAAPRLEGSARVDNASIQQKMPRNRKSLEVKLQLRPPKLQLIEQGILPAAGTPPSFVEQRNRLQRAQTGDTLKHKIEQRPDKRELVSQRILLDSGGTEPGILEKTRQLKRHRLADSLNDKLAARPGPLELVQDNILHVDDGLQQAVKEGLVPFKPTSAGTVDKHPAPVFLVQELGHQSPQTLMIAPLEAPYAGETYAVADQGPPKPSKFKKPKPNVPPPQPASPPAPAKQQFLTPPPANSAAAQAAARNKIIKFHEYKGPRPVHWGGLGSPAPSMEPASPASSLQSQPNPGPPSEPGKETSYDLLLQQQQLFLQWQLELQAKYPGHNIQFLPMGPAFGAGVSGGPGGVFTAAPPSPNSSTSVSSTSPYSGAGEPSPAPPARASVPVEEGQWTSAEPVEEPVGRKPPQLIRPPLRRLEDLRVSELKAHCKRRGLPVSGPKPQLIERLRGVEAAVVAETREELAAAELPQASPSWEQAGSCTTETEFPSPGAEQYAQPQPQVSSSFSFAAQGSGGQFTAMGQQGIEQQASGSAQPPPPPPPVVVEQERAPTPAALVQQPMETQAQMDNPLSPSVISTSALSLHEEMLRHQQRKVEELQGELARAQDQLRHQQAVIVAARKAQTEASSSDGKSEAESVAEAWLSHIDTKHLQRFHIQLFLQHKIQQQRMQGDQRKDTFEAMLATARELAAGHAQLSEATRVEAAVEEVRALIAREPAAALTLLQGLREPQQAQEEETLATEASPGTSQAAWEPPPPPPPVIQRKASAERRTEPVPSNSRVDMEEIFKAVLAAAKDGVSPSPQPEATPAPPPPPSFAYTNNEAFDDLMEVIRCNDQVEKGGLDDFGGAFPSSIGGGGSQELSSLLGPDWLDLPPSTAPHSSPDQDWFPTGVSESSNSFEAASTGLSIDQSVGFESLGFGGGDEMEWLDQLALPSAHRDLNCGEAEATRSRKTSNPLLAQSVFGRDADLAT